MKAAASLRPRRALAVAASLAALALRPATAHTWAESIMHIAPNGTMVGPQGYMRGFVSRDAPGFSDDGDVWLLPPNDGRPNTLYKTDNMCHPFQAVSNYSAAFPMLAAAPGDFIAVRYQENGHVTLTDINPTKPIGGGTVYVYGTDQPADGEKFLDVWKQWTADGQGGNKKGRLIATRTFDDGQCYQVNGGRESPAAPGQVQQARRGPPGHQPVVPDRHPDPRRRRRHQELHHVLGVALADL